MAESTTTFALNAEDLKTLRSLAAITQVIEKYPELQGILVETSGFAVATDGRRLFRRRIAGLESNRVPFLVGPWQATDHITSGDTAELRMSEASIELVGVGKTAELTLIDKPFPPYEQRVPTDDGVARLTFEPDQLGLITPFFRLLAGRDQSPAVLELSPSTVTVFANDKNAGAETRVTLPVETGAAGILRLAINPQYWLSAVQALDPRPGSPLSVDIYGETRPIVFRQEAREEEYCIVMPMQMPA